MKNKKKKRKICVSMKEIMNEQAYRIISGRGTLPISTLRRQIADQKRRKI